jgi:hypothetical protein
VGDKRDGHAMFLSIAPNQEGTRKKRATVSQCSIPHFVSVQNITAIKSPGRTGVSKSLEFPKNCMYLGRNKGKIFSKYKFVHFLLHHPVE